MADRIKGITIEIDGDTTKLKSALKGVDSEIRSAQTNLRDLNKLLKVDPGNTQLLQQKYKNLGKVVDATKEKLATLQKAQEQMEKSGDINTDEYDALQREIEDTKNKLKGLEKEYKNFGSVQAQQVAAAGQKIGEVGGKISGVGTKMTALTATITAVGTASIAAFNEVDAGMDIIEQKTGASGKALKDMEQIAKDMATEIPTDFETAGSAVGEVNTRFGLTGKELQKLSTKFVKFASLNNTDVSSSIDVVQKSLTAFGLESKDAGAMLDTLNSVGQKTGISMDTLSQLMVSNASAFKQMGLSASDAAEFLGQCEMSGTDTSAVMTGLTKAMKQATKDGKPLDQALAEIQSSMVNAKSDTEGLSVAYEMFGSRAGGKIYEACKSGSLSFESLGTSLADNLGNVDSTYQNTLDGTDEMITSMNALKEAGAAVGSALGTALAPIVKALGGKLKEFAQWFSNLSPGMQNMIVKIGLIVAAIGPVLIVIGKAVSGIGSLMTLAPKISGAITAVKGAFAALNTTMLANPVVLVIAAITALVAAFIYLWNHCEGFRNFWINLWNSVKQIAVTVWNGLKSFFSSAWNAISGTAKKVFNGIKTFFSTVWNGIKKVVTTVVNTIKTVVSTAWNGIKTVVTTVMNTIKNAISTVWNGIKNTVGKVIGGIKNVISSGMNGAKSVITGILDKIKSKFSSIWEGAKKIVSGAIEKIKGFMNFKWQLPKIKLPHFSVSGKLSLDPPSMPKFSVKWYKTAMENGTILNRPTIFGMQGGKLLGGGDAGQEAVVGVDSLKNMIQAAVAGAGGDIIIPVYIGQERIDEIVVRASRRHDYRSGGRS